MGLKDNAIQTVSGECPPHVMEAWTVFCKVAGECGETNDEALNCGFCAVATLIGCRGKLTWDLTPREASDMKRLIYSAEALRGARINGGEALLETGL